MFESGGQPGVVEQQIDPIERFEVFSAFGFAAYVETERAATAALRFDGRFERCQPFGAAPVAMMSYPRAASRSAVACPMPEVAPVIKACFFIMVGLSNKSKKNLCYFA